MISTFDRRAYWERKIIPWEQARYWSNLWLSPNSWTLRRRLTRGADTARKLLPHGGTILELGCGSGILAAELSARGHDGQYFGIDIAESAITAARARNLRPEMKFSRADILQEKLPTADLTIFLGLVDWLDIGEIQRILRAIPSRTVLFSYTEAPGRFSPYQAYRRYHDFRFSGGRYCARSFLRQEVETWLRSSNFDGIDFLPHFFLDPGRLVVATKSRA